MADGNMGNLFISLGIKDEMSNALQKIIKNMNGVDQATLEAKKRGEELVNSLNNINGRNFSNIFREANEYIEKNSKGVSGIAKMLGQLKATDLNVLTGKVLNSNDLTHVASILRTINSELSKRDDKDEASKAWRIRISNALDYIKLLQDINSQQKKISNTKAENPNVDTKSLDNARKSLAGIRSEIAGLLSSGGVDNADVLRGFTKLLSIAKADVKEIVSTFKKDSALSNFTGGAAKVEADIARVTEKLAKMRDLMAEGTSKGYNTSMLTGSITELDNILSRLQSAKLNPSMLTDAAQMRNLISDVLVEMTKATAATQAYGREKGKVIAQERAYNASLKKSTDEANKIAVAERQRNEALARTEVLLRNVDALTARSNELKVDTSTISQARAAVTELQQKIESFSGKDLLSNDFKDLLSNLREAKIGVNQILKEQSAENRKAKAEIDAQSDALKKAASEANKADIAYNNLKNTIERANKAHGNGLKLFDDINDTVKIRQTLSALETLRTTLEQIKNSGVGYHPILGITTSQYLSSAEFVNTLNNAKLAISEQEKQNAAQERINRSKQRSNGLEDEHAKLLKQSSAVQAQLVKGFERANSHAGKLNSTIQDLKSLFLQGGLVFGAQQFAMSIITTGGEMEKQHIALQSILGDMQNANTMFNQIKELALNSPFTFSELNRDVKQLAAYGVEYDQLYDTTKRLADMSSGLGVSFDRIALAFGQVQARGWLDGKELRQIAYAGIPLLNKLSEFYSKQEGRNVSTSEIKTRISNREVSFDDVKSIFWQMTNEGGQFYNMQQTLSETLLGRYNKLKDAWEIMLADFADGKSIVGGTFKFIIDQVTSLVQLMHTFSPVVVGAMSGFALKKVGTLLAGSAASNFLTNKEKIAQDIKARALSGQQLSAVEQRILATKKQITREDLQTLVAAKAITKTEMQRLYLSGKISKEMYKQAMTQAGMNTFWTNFANKGGAAISLLGKGLGSMVSSLWAMIGGLPGLIITAVTMGIGYAVSKYQELSRSIEQTQSELIDRLKQIRDFRADNASNMAKALSDGDTKEIDNLIDSYKEKLKELAPYNFNNLVMNAEEKKSHIERLKYLDQELQKLQEAEKLAKSKLNNKSNYGDLKDAIDYANQFYDNKDKLTYKYISDGVDKNEARKKAFSVDKYADFNANQIKNQIQNIFGDISKDDTLRLAAEQAMSSVFSTLGVPEDRANEIRASVLQAFGIGEKDSWLQGEVRSKMQALIDETFPEIGAKIRANIPLTKAEQDKVKELMDDAKQGLIRQYPELESTLQNLLKSSNFQAVIKLVFATDDKFNDMTSELIGRIPENLNGLATKDIAAKYRSFAKKWGKDNSWYGGRNAAKSDIDAAYNEYQSALKSKSKDVNSKRDAWILTRDAAKALLYYDYTGEGKKSNKPGKKNTGRQEDKELKALQERLSSLKSARQMYQKYKTIMPDEEAKNKTYDLFPEITGLNLDDYEKAVKSLMDKFDFNKSAERKKMRTSLYREIAEWVFSERDKVAFDKKTADFAESLDRLVNRWDLYKSLLEKTGNKNYAQAAWIDGFQEDDKSKSLMDEYYARYKRFFNLQDALSLTDGEAKLKFKEAGEYDLWKKIVDLLRNNYTTALQDGADAMQQTMSMAQKLDSITQKYNEKRKKAGDNQDLIGRYNYLEKQEKSGVLFDQLKSEINWDGVFGNLDNYTRKELRKIRKQIRDLVAGGILDGMSTTDLKSFYDGMEKLNQAIDGQGFSGLSDLIKEMVDASQKYDDAVKEYNDALKTYGKDNWQTEAARKKMQEAEARKRNATGSVSTKKNTVWGNIATLTDIFKTLGLSDGSGSTLLNNAGGWTSSIMKMFGSSDKNSQKVGGIVGMFAGLTEAISEKGFGGFLSDAFEDIGGAVNSIFKDVFGLNLGISGADYSDYNKAKAEYDNLINVWDTLISKKKTYLSEHWGTEAQNASKEAMALLQSEIEQTKVIAQNRLGSGASMGSHSIGYRMWKGSYKYNGQNWRDVAGDISSKYGVQFNGMEDMLNMAPDVLEKIKTEYSGLWANMDSDFRDYLDKLIEYGDQVDEMTESLTEKLTGNRFSDLVSSWGDAMASMANSSDSLVDHFEENLKKTILNSMIENIYGDKIKALIAKTKKYAENGDKITDSNGDVISEYTGAEYADVKASTEDIAKQIEATRDFLKKTYGWSDSSSSSSTNSVKGITEETADIIVSYISAIRLDVSVNRENIKLIADAVKELPNLNIIAESQLAAMNQLVSLAEYRNSKLDDMYSWMRSVTKETGTKSIRMK